MTTNYNTDVGVEEFDDLLDEEAFAIEEQTADVSSSSSTFFNTNQQQDRYYPPIFPSNLNLDANFTPEFGRPSDWVLPPNLTPLTDLESLSSSASAGVYHDSSFNPFDFTLSGVNSTINNGAFVSRNPYASLTPNGSSYRNDYYTPYDGSYVNPNSMQQPLDAAHFEYDVERSGGENPMPGQRAYQFTSIPNSPLPSPSLAPPQTRNRLPAWGQSRSRGSSSSTSSQPQRQSRRTSMDQKEQTSSGPSLRSTAGTYRAGTTSSSGTFSTMNGTNENPKMTRNNHDQIEKQYRNRLNSQFEVLLSILPKEEVVPPRIAPEGEGRDENVLERVEERKVSKAEVLDMATKHIRKLEREGKDLNGENKLLKLKVEELNRIWVEHGGMVMPR